HDDACGGATVSLSSLAAVSHSLRSYYGGTNNFDSSSSNTVSQPVSKKATSCILSVSPNPSTFGQSVTLKDSVSGPPPGGKVYFRVDGTPIDSANVNGTGVETLDYSDL